MLERFIKRLLVFVSLFTVASLGAVTLTTAQAAPQAQLPSYFHWGSTSDHHGKQPCMLVWSATKRTKKNTVELCKGGFHTHAVRIMTSSFVKPRGSFCDTGESCFYPRTDTNGAVVDIPNSGSHGFWFNLCNVTGECQPLSIWENGGSCLWLYTNSTRATELLTDGGVDQNTHNAYDWAYIKYGTSTCGDNPPRPLP